MLHIVFVTHTPMTCPAADTEIRVKAYEGLSKMHAVCEERGMKVSGEWVDRPAHAIYLLIDAPNAHMVTELATDLRLSDWSTVNVAPVIEVEDLRQALAQM